ncbi:Exopolygalacturonase X-2 [Aspergillus granulosus]|uniref:galacturonan 1,4-alpha-galacturonidase n=1 Tax=Aspergillus granulosus TaxID=176169 RepID=A0ABR4HF29_9EURO
MVAKGALSLLIGLLLAFATQTSAHPGPKDAKVPKRPNIQPGPYQPYKAIPLDTRRDRHKVCFVKPGRKGGDDAPRIHAALRKCNNGGTVVLDKEYTIRSPLDLRFLKHIDIALTGTVEFGTDIEFWQHNLFRFHFQSASSWWVWGGEDIHLYGAGTGVIHGNGQTWYDEYAINGTITRPILFITDGWHGGSITGLKLRHSPNWHNLIANSSDLLISDMDIFSRSFSDAWASNLDGWDTFRSDNVVIQNSNINHDDDCVSFKPNSTNIIVQGLHCNGSHGISVGSLGNYPYQYDIVSDLYIYNNTMANTTTAARLKVWPGAEAIKKGNPPWVGGGGAGYVRNVTYDTMINDNNNLAIQIDQCYGAINSSECEDHPSKVILTDVLFKNMWGTANGADDPVAGQLICGSEGSCDNIRAENVTISNPSGEPPQWQCRFQDEELLDLGGVGCIPA